MDTTTASTTRSPLLYWLIGGCLIALIAAIYLGFFWSGRSEAAAQSGDARQAADAAVSAAGLNDKERSAMEAIVRDYILEHPEIITEAVAVLQQRDVSARLEGVRDSVEQPFAKGFAGNPNGDVVLVEFFDYACGYCRQSLPDVDRLLAEDKNLKVVYRELPILSEASREAALWSLAAAIQGKYPAFHDALFKAGKPSGDSIQTAARTVGLDIEAARAFTATPEAKAEIEKNLGLARTIGFSGTPSWVVGDQTFDGAVGYEALKDAVAKAREAG